MNLLEIKPKPGSNNKWETDLYTIQLRDWNNKEMHFITIRRKDDKPIHNWEHFQLIKNYILGDEIEAFELYPAESKLINLGNAYHLLAWKDQKAHPSFGFKFRKVLEHEHKESDYNE